MKANVYGFGKECLDIITINDEVYTYQSGGTVFNVLANLSKYDFQTYACGIIGTDIAGSIVTDHLNSLGINTSNLIKKSTKTNKIYSNINIDGGTFIKTIEKKTCPLCKASLINSSIGIKDTISNKSDIDIAIFDSLAKDRLEIAATVKRLNKIVVFDIGYVGNLRYCSQNMLLKYLELPYNIIQMNGRVALFLKTRLNITEDSDILKLLGCELLIITNGEAGSQLLYYENGEISLKVIKFKVNDIKDTTGAGDAFLSGVIIAYNENWLDKSVFINNVAKYTKAIVSLAIRSYGGIGHLYSQPLKNIFTDKKSCRLCGCDLSRPITKRQAPNLLNNALKNIERNIKLAKKSPFAANLNNLIDKIDGEVLVVGTGASFTTSNLIATCLNNYKTTIRAKAIRPRDLYDERLEHKSYVLLCSYSGMSNDITSLLPEIKKHGIKTVLITHGLINDSQYDYILSYGTEDSPHERGFISIESIIVPLYFFVKLFADKKEDYEFYISSLLAEKKQKEYILNIKEKNNIVDIISDATSYPLAVDLESKFIESNFGRVTIHDKKDISHGRYVTLKNSKSDILVYYNYQNTEYQKKLVKYLNNMGYNNIVFIGSDNKNKILKLYEMVIENQIFFGFLGNLVKKDLSSPGYEDKDIVLYKHKGDIR